MAYLARIEPAHAALVPAAPVPLDEPIPEAQFSDLEWSIIRLAKVDRLWTLRPATRLRRFLNRLLARNPNPTLANPKLESLRRMAVLSWHFGFTVAGEDVAEFIESGFSLEQYELLVISVLGAGSNVIPFGKAGRA
jgi:hypothetical protein